MMETLHFKDENLVFIVIAIYLIHFGSLATGISKDKLEINVETLIRSDTAILPTTVIKTQTLKSSSPSDQSKITASLCSIKSAGTFTSRLILTTKVVSTITSTASALVTYTTTAPTSSTINGVSSCNATNPFDFILPSKQMLLENYRVNNFTQRLDLSVFDNKFGGGQLLFEN